MHPASPSTLLAALHWRYATQKFDPAKKIPDDTWTALEHTLVLTPSSIGLQPWKFVIVTDPAVKTQLSAASWHQRQPADCSHFVVFAVRKDLDADHVDRHVARMVEVQGVAHESLTKFRQMTMGNLEKARAKGELDTWQTHQIYIALGNFMTAAAVIGVDTCPMEGISQTRFDEILGLAGTGYFTVVGCAAGYRAGDDKRAAAKKVRFKPDDVIVRI